MAIAKTGTALGATGVNLFGTTQQNNKISEIVDAVNNLTDGSITTTDLTLTGGLTVGTTSTLTGAVTYGAINTDKALVGLTALAGGAQAGTAITATYNSFTTVASELDSAQLPVAVLGRLIRVKNIGVHTLAVFPQTGAYIDEAGAANIPLLVPPSQTVTFTGVSATGWQSSVGTTKVSNIITKEVTLTAAEIVGTAAGDLGHANGAVLVEGVSSAYAMEFVSAVVIYDFATAAYTGGGDDTTINIGSGGAALTGVVTSANLIGAAGDKVVLFNPLSTAALSLSVGTGLSMNSVTAWTQPGTAAGVIRVKISYRFHRTGL